MVYKLLEKRGISLMTHNWSNLLRIDTPMKKLKTIGELMLRSRRIGSFGRNFRKWRERMKKMSREISKSRDNWMKSQKTIQSRSKSSIQMSIKRSRSRFNWRWKTLKTRLQRERLCRRKSIIKAKIWRKRKSKNQRKKKKS
jgi:hypothetical protein